jgi:hypothetical protein
MSWAHLKFDYHSAVRNTKVYKIRKTLNDCIFHILRYFATNLHSSTTLTMLWLSLRRAQYESIQNSQTLKDCIFHILRVFFNRTSQFYYINDDLSSRGDEFS